MTSSTISQALNNAALPAQTGGGVVVEQQVNFNGGDALIGFAASAYSAAVGPMSMELWLDGQPTGGLLTLWANQAEMHLSMGRSYVWCVGVTPGQHTIALLAGDSTVTDGNDIACVTVWEMGDGCAVRFADDVTCPTGVSETLIKESFDTDGGQLLLSASSSGWVTQAGSMVQGFLVTDGGDGVGMEVWANNAEQHLATVPVDLAYGAPERGQHVVQVNAGGLTSTDGGDSAHVAVVEWVNPPDAPVVLNLNPPLLDTPCNQQSGDGGTVAQSTFASNGGTLLVRVNVSCWTSEPPGLPLYIGVQVDGTSLGFTQIWANFQNTHMAMVSNDLVLTGVAAGNHTLNLMGEANVNTDGNDRVSVLIMEFPAG